MVVAIVLPVPVIVMEPGMVLTTGRLPLELLNMVILLGARLKVCVNLSVV